MRVLGSEARLAEVLEQLEKAIAGLLRRPRAQGGRLIKADELLKTQ